MATRLRERSCASSTPAQRPSVRRSKAKPNFTFSDVAMWLATLSEKAVDDPQDECGQAPIRDDVRLTQEIWETDGGVAEVEFRINQIAKRFRSPQLGAELNAIASITEEENV